MKNNGIFRVQLLFFSVDTGAASHTETVKKQTAGAPVTEISYSQLRYKSTGLRLAVL